MERKYDTDLTDDQWNIVRNLLPKPSGKGRPRIDWRRVIDAILYLSRTGCQWRQLPHDFPKWSSVYTVFWRFRRAGVWQAIHDKLREKVRRSVEKKSTPTVAIIDSQSIKTTEVGGEERAYDAGKKVSGRKRHIAVDTLGLLLVVIVHAANWQDYDGAKPVIMALSETSKRIKVIFADAAYGRVGLPAWAKASFGYVLQCILRPVKTKGFVVLPKRWIVERTFAWINRSRRHSKDYERTTQSSESLIYVSMIHLMLRRLAPVKSRL